MRNTAYRASATVRFFLVRNMARNSTGWFLPPTTTSYDTTSYDTSYYSSPRVYRDGKNHSDTRIVNHERNYYDQHRSFEPMLHPDTLEPMDPNMLQNQNVSKAERANQAISRSKGPVELRIDGSWSLGITMSSDGMVQRIHEGTPASKARLIFESRVRTMNKPLHRLIDTLG